VTATFDPALLATFVLVVTRLVAAMTVAPPFDGSQIPVQVRLGLAVAIGLAVAPHQVTDVPTDVPGLVTALAYQVLVGLMMGFVIKLLLSAVPAAGALIDLSVGYSSATLFDPFSQAAATPVARLYQLLTVVLLMVLNGHLLIIKGILRSYEAAPLDGLRLDSLSVVLTEGIGQLLIAAVEIAFPVLVALLLADGVLGLVSRAAPKLNVMVLGFAVKSLVLVFVLGLGLPLVSNGVSTLLVRGVRWATALAGGA
jgi:flagellar biosynthetic protein FliR